MHAPRPITGRLAFTSSLLTTDILGDVFSLTVTTRTGDGYGERAYVDRQPFFRTMPRLLVFETGVHFIDVFRYLFGEPERLGARLRTLNPAIQGEDAGIVQLEFPSGVVATWDANRYNESAEEDARFTFGTFRCDARKGHVCLAGDGTMTFKPLGQPVEEVPYAHPRMHFGSDCVHAFQQHVVDVLLRQVPAESEGAEYLRNMRLVDAAYAANKTRQTVTT